MDIRVLTEAIDGFERRLTTGDGSTWSAATPCGDWDLHTLVNHVVNELLWIPPLLDGLTIAEVGDSFDRDVLGDQPVASFRTAGAAAVAAASVPGAQERTVHLSFGDLPGAGYLEQVTSDVVIHTWDLARAVGADDHLDPALVQFVADALGPQMEAWRSAGAFGPAADAGPEPSAQDILLAQTGRSPGWFAHS